MERSVGVVANRYGFFVENDKITSMELDSGDWLASPVNVLKGMEWYTVILIL